MMSVENPAELRPWAIVGGMSTGDRAAADKANVGNLAVWRIAAPADSPAAETPSGELALALFTSHETAEEYRVSHGSPVDRVMRLDEVQTLQVILAGYQQGIRYAALDPGANSARQIFVLRDVLKSAKQQMSKGS